VAFAKPDGSLPGNGRHPPIRVHCGQLQLKMFAAESVQRCRPRL